MFPEAEKLSCRVELKSIKKHHDRAPEWCVQSSDVYSDKSHLLHGIDHRQLVHDEWCEAITLLDGRRTSLWTQRRTGGINLEQATPGLPRQEQAASYNGTLRTARTGSRRYSIIQIVVVVAFFFFFSFGLDLERTGELLLLLYTQRARGTLDGS